MIHLDEKDERIWRAIFLRDENILLDRLKRLFRGFEGERDERRGTSSLFFRRIFNDA